MSETKLTDGAMAALEAAGSIERAVIWPHRDCTEVRRFGTAQDGRTHFIAPTGDALDLFAAKLINSDGEITDAGRAALSRTKEG
jgi:hypothetical protein